MTDTNQLREAFEVRMTDGGKWPAAVERGRGGAYRLAQTENAWTEWQACAESLQARAQVQGEPVAWMHWLNGPVRVFMNKDVAMMELDRLNREYPLDTDDRKMRPLLFGDTAPQPTQATQAASAEDMKVYDSIADRYFREATQAEVTDGIRPEDFTVDVVVKPMVGFAPVNTQGVRVTHIPTGISVTCDVARSQHTNRHQAFEKLRAILALHPAQVAAPMSEIDIEDDASLRFVQRVLESDAPKEDRQSARDMVVGLRKRVRKAHHGITTQAKKETP